MTDNNKAMEDMRVLRVVSKFILPFIIMFGFYVQFHGEYSPGGGFQAGIIIAAGLILYALIFGSKELLQVIPLYCFQLIAGLGVLLYGFVGVFAMMVGGNFLEYSVLLANKIAGQHLGIILIELGVGMTVMSVSMLLFLTFARRPSQSG